MLCVQWNELKAVEMREKGFVKEEELKEALNDRFGQAKAENSFSFRQELRIYK